MLRQLRRIAIVACSLLPLLAGSSSRAEDKPAPREAGLTLVVMDPLAAPLACPCVKGYAQRDYAKLAQLLEKHTGEKVSLFFGETLPAVYAGKAKGKADIVIGKYSVAKHGGEKLKLPLRHVAALTGKDGLTTQTGLFLVPAKDPALVVSDLTAYRIIFGPADCDEKHRVALDLLREHGIIPKGDLETSEACSESATEVLQIFGEGGKGATVISSYAKPLLEGCGTINKGDLRVIGETTAVPFVAAFVNQNLPEKLQKQIEDALFQVGGDKALCQALETKEGFTRPKPDVKKKN
ncbi:MAG: PhnD/SsuA/transferrin family substrate-binding protein [Planctomycetales bacterium]